MNRLHLILVSLLLAFASAAFGATAYEFDASVEVFERGEKARVAVDRFGRFYAVAQDIAATTSTIRYAYSTDFSLTEWNAVRNVISAADVYELPDVAVGDDGMVHVAFHYTASANDLFPQYRNARSFDEAFSASANAETAGAASVLASAALPLGLIVETINGTQSVYIFWKRNASAAPVQTLDITCSYAQVYKYSPATFTAVAVSSQTQVSEMAVTSKAIPGDNASNLFAAWIYTTDIYYDKSTAAAPSFTTDTLISASAALAEDIDIAAGDDNWDTDTNDDLIVVWSDRRNGYSQIYADWSRDAGTTWQTDIQVLGTATRYYDQDSPSVTMGQEDGKIHLTWRDMRHGTSSIYYIQGIYSAAGISWGVDADEDGVMDSGELNDVLQVDDDEHDAVQKDPCVSVDRYGNVIVAWHDTFTGNIRSAALLYNVD